jgi:protein-disulfide isomerase
LDAGTYAQKVNDHLTSGQKAGVTGTPGTVVLSAETGETQLIPGAYPYEQVKQVIDSML